MNFDVSYYELKEKNKRKLVYEKNTGEYNILIFTDTDESIGLFDKSDAICVFENRTGALVSVTERVDKKGLNIFQRLQKKLTKKSVMKKAPVGYECFVYDKGAYFEYQYYRRWWYDLNLEIGAIGVVSSASNSNG